MLMVVQTIIGNVYVCQDSHLTMATNSNYLWPLSNDCLDKHGHLTMPQIVKQTLTMCMVVKTQLLIKFI